MGKRDLSGDNQSKNVPWEIDSTEKKKKVRRGIFLILALAAAIYMCIGIYFGQTGKNEYFQHEFWCVAFREVWVHPRWFLHSVAAGMALILCLYGYYRTKSEKKHYVALGFCMLIPYFAIGLLTTGAPLLIFMMIFIGGMFAMANLPGKIGRSLTHKLLAGQENPETNAEQFADKQLRTIEWIRCFPLKRVLIAGMWLFCPVMGILGIVSLYKVPETDSLWVILLLFVVAALTAKKAWRYILTPYHCMPVLNQILSKEQIQKLLVGEQFQEVSFEDEDLKKYVPVLLSENWALIEGILISRRLAVSVYIDFSISISRRSSWIKGMYLNGETFRTRSTDIYLGGKYSDEMTGKLKEIRQIHFLNSVWMTRQEPIREKYRTILPEISDEKQKMWHLLTEDISDIQQDYAKMFGPGEKSKKRKKF